jgi:hypothetical protein
MANAFATNSLCRRRSALRSYEQANGAVRAGASAFGSVPSVNKEACWCPGRAQQHDKTFRFLHDAIAPPLCICGKKFASMRPKSTEIISN